MKLSKLLNYSLGVTALGFLGFSVGTANAATAPSPFTDYAGSYEALLVSGDGLAARPAGKFELTVAKNGTYSAKVTAKEAKTFGFNGALEVVDGSLLIKPKTSGALREVQIVRGKSIANYVVTFSVAGGVLHARVTTSEYDADADDGVRIKAFTGKDKADWAGAYTMALASPVKLDDAIDQPIPSGSGYATLAVDSKGVLKYTGKLPDGTSITGSLAPGQSRDYRLFLNPHKTTDSYLAGELSLVSLSAGGFTGGDEMELFWRKSAAAKPAVFTQGFGPLAVAARIAPWTVPAKGQTLAQLLGVENKQFSFAAFGDASLAQAYPGRVPVRLSLDKAGNLVPVYGDSLAPKTPKDWAKIWSGKVDAKTGKFTASIKVVDFVAGSSATGQSKQGGDRYNSAKIVNRTIKIEGVLLRTTGGIRKLSLDDVEQALFEILGYYELLAGGGINLSTYGGFEAADEVEEVGVGAPAPGAIAPGTPGNYSFVVKTEAVVDTSMIPTGTSGFSLISQEAPPAALVNGSTVNFSISADLTKLTWAGGRVLKLASDGRIQNGGSYGGSLVYADTTAPGAKAPKKNNLVVVFHLKGDGSVRDVLVNNVFVLPAKWRISVPAQTIIVGGKKFTTPAINTVASAFTVAVYTYSDLSDAVKIP